MEEARVETPEAADVNHVQLTGRVSAVPERRTLPSGDEVVALRVVVKRDDGGVDTVPVQVGPAPPAGRRPGPGQVGRRSLASAQRLTTTDRVAVTGGLRRRWWAAGGARRSVLEVRATRVEPLGSDG